MAHSYKNKAENKEIILPRIIRENISDKTITNKSIPLHHRNREQDRDVSQTSNHQASQTLQNTNDFLYYNKPQKLKKLQTHQITFYQF